MRDVVSSGEKGSLYHGAESPVGTLDFHSEGLSGVGNADENISWGEREGSPWRKVPQ